MPTRLLSTSIEAVSHAALAGMGIACLPDFMTRDAESQGLLHRVLDTHLQHVGQFWILWPSSRHATAKLRVFIDHLALRLFSVNEGRIEL